VSSALEQRFPDSVFLRNTKGERARFKKANLGNRNWAGWVHLQSYGKAPAVLVSDLKVGDYILYNYGYKSQIKSITPKGKASVVVETESAKDGKLYDRTYRLKSLIPILSDRQIQIHQRLKSKGYAAETKTKNQQERQIIFSLAEDLIYKAFDYYNKCLNRDGYHPEDEDEEEIEDMCREAVALARSIGLDVEYRPYMDNRLGISDLEDQLYEEGMEAGLEDSFGADEEFCELCDQDTESCFCGYCDNYRCYNNMSNASNLDYKPIGVENLCEHGFCIVCHESKPITVWDGPTPHAAMSEPYCSCGKFGTETFGAEEGNTKWDRALAQMKKYSPPEEEVIMFSHIPKWPYDAWMENNLPPYFNKELVDEDLFDRANLMENVVLFLPSCDSSHNSATLQVSQKISREKVVKQLKDWGIDTSTLKHYLTDWGVGGVEEMSIYEFEIPHTLLCDWSNAYVRDTYYDDDDGTGYTTFGQDCLRCNAHRRGDIGGKVSWDMKAEKFGAEAGTYRINWDDGEEGVTFDYEGGDDMDFDDEWTDRFWDASNPQVKKDAESFNAVVIAPEPPKGIVEKALMNHYLFQESTLRQALMEIENRVELGLMSVEEAEKRLNRLIQQKMRSENYASENTSKKLLSGVFMLVAVASLWRAVTVTEDTYLFPKENKYMTILGSASIGLGILAWKGDSILAALED